MPGYKSTPVRPLRITWQPVGLDLLVTRCYGAEAEVRRLGAGRWSFFILYPSGHYVYKGGLDEDCEAMRLASEELLKWREGEINETTGEHDVCDPGRKTDPDEDA